MAFRNVPTSEYEQIQIQGFDIYIHPDVKKASLYSQLITKITDELTRIVNKLPPEKVELLQEDHSVWVTDRENPHEKKGTPASVADYPFQVPNQDIYSNTEINRVNIYLFGGTSDIQNILLHEYAHLYEDFVMAEDKEQAIQKSYQNAMEQGLYQGFYAESNQYEYFAQLTAAYFDEATFPQDRTQLRCYDKTGYEMIQHVWETKDERQYTEPCKSKEEIEEEGRERIGDRDEAIDLTIPVAIGASLLGIAIIGGIGVGAYMYNQKKQAGKNKQTSGLPPPAHVPGPVHTTELKTMPPRIVPETAPTAMAVLITAKDNSAKYGVFGKNKPLAIDTTEPMTIHSPGQHAATGLSNSNARVVESGTNKVFVAAHPILNARASINLQGAMGYPNQESHVRTILAHDQPVIKVTSDAIGPVIQVNQVPYA